MYPLPALATIPAATIRLPDHMVAPTQDLDGLIKTVFGVLGKDSPVGKAILVTSSHKRDGNEINHKITQQFQGIIHHRLPAVSALPVYGTAKTSVMSPY